MINKRLKKISDSLEEDSVVLDIGCDHALLEIYTKQKRPSITMVGSDIRKGPLEKAKENLKKYHLENQISLLLADGLDCYQEKFDTVVISGMGEETITAICEKKKEILPQIKHLILSPNNNFYELRKNIVALGFQITDETLVLERGKYYLVIHFQRGKKNYTEEELFFGPILMAKREVEFLNYYQELKRSQEQLLKEIPKSKEEIREKMEENIKKISTLFL